jgi:hypothetical protein
MLKIVCIRNQEIKDFLQKHMHARMTSPTLPQPPSPVSHVAPGSKSNAPGEDDDACVETRTDDVSPSACCKQSSSISKKSSSSSKTPAKKYSQSKFYRLCNHFWDLINACPIENSLIIQRLVKKSGMEKLYPLLYPHMEFVDHGNAGSPRPQLLSKSTASPRLSAEPVLPPQQQQQQQQQHAFNNSGRASSLGKRRDRDSDVDPNNKDRDSQSNSTQFDLLLQNNTLLTKMNNELFQENKRMRCERVAHDFSMVNSRIHQISNDQSTFGLNDETFIFEDACEDDCVTFTSNSLSDSAA